MSDPSNGKSVPPNGSTSELTDDAFFNGRLRITQMRQGYRFSIDSVLLAAAVAPKNGQIVVDLGTGCGIIPIILSCRHPSTRLYGIELQAELAELARMNSAANHLQDRFFIIEEDMQRISQKDLGGSADWVVANPPYRRLKSGRINPAMQKALARHEIYLNLAQLIQTANRLLRIGGWMAVIYPAERMADLLIEMQRHGIEPKWVRAVHSYPREPAKLVIVQGIKHGRAGLAIPAPIVIYETDGSYTQEVQMMMAL